MTLYLDQGPGRMLSVTGPTKSGKTVLVERLLPRDLAIWVEGQDLASVDVLWDRVVDWLGLHDLVGVTRQEAEGTGKQLGMSVGVPKVVSVDASRKDDATTTLGVRKTRKQAISTVARDSLEAVGTPIVIDDFHHVADDREAGHREGDQDGDPVQQGGDDRHPAGGVRRRAIRTRHGLPRLAAGDRVVVRDELTFIAERGFEALAIGDSDGVAATLAMSSYGAPFLMQELCYQYVTTELRLIQTPEESIVATPPEDWSAFFAAIANRHPPAILSTLLRGPKERGAKRTKRILKTGEQTDIYGALLHAIAKAGKAMVSYTELAVIIDRDFREPIAGQQIGASLGHMSPLANLNRGTGDAAVTYKNDDLHVLDPFLLYYLRHGSWSVEKPHMADESEQETLSVA